MSKSFAQLIEDISKTFGNSHVLLIMASEPTRKPYGFLSRDLFYIPLNPAMIRRIFGLRSAKAWHITAPHLVKYVSNIQKTRKAISVTTRLYSDVMLEGVEGGGRAVLLLRGNVISSFPYDSYTITDENGKRWVALRMIFKDVPGSERIEESVNREITQLRDKLFRKYHPIFEDDIKRLSDGRRLLLHDKFESLCITIHALLPEFKNSSARRKISNMIEEYMVGLEKIIANHADDMNSVLFAAFQTKKTREEIDEWVMDNIEIEKVYIVHNVSKAHFKDIEVVGGLLDLIDELPPGMGDRVTVVNTKELEGISPYNREVNGYSRSQLEALFAKLEERVR